MVGLGGRGRAFHWLMTLRMSKVCESWSLEDLVDMNEEDMEALLEFYEPGTVPSLQSLRYGEGLDEFGFDGSFGWW